MDEGGAGSLLEGAWERIGAWDRIGPWGRIGARLRVDTSLLNAASNESISEIRPADRGWEDKGWEDRGWEESV